MMSSPKSLSGLAATIQSHASEIENYMINNGMAQATFETDSPLAVQLPPALSRAREEALEALTHLHSLMLGPLPYLMRLMSPAVNIFNSLHAIYRFNIAQKLGLEETITYEELASRCDLNASDLRRLLRLAIANHIFAEPSENMIAHTAMSRVFIDIPAFHDWAGVVCEDMLPASIYCVDAMSKWPGSSDASHTGFALANGTERSYFDELGMDPSRASRFANAMTLNNSARFLDPSWVVNNMPWSTGSTHKSVIDIGGSHGVLGVQLLKAFPEIEEYVVQDLPEVIAGARAPDEVAARLKFQEYNFFTEQETKGADIYFLRLVLHDWPDDTAISILRNQVSAMGPHSRIILNEICLPKVGAVTCYQEQYLRGLDLDMKQMFNGKERDAKEWNALIAQTDPRLHIREIISPAGSLLSIIEVVM